MVDFTTVTTEEMAVLLTNLTKTIEELNTTVAALQASISELKNENELLSEENKYLKRKLFGTKSETSHALGLGQLSFFDEAEKECDEELLEEIKYQRHKTRHKGERKLKLENLKHVEDVYTIDEKDRVCKRCGSKMVRIGKEFVRSEVIYEPAKLYVKDYYRETYECRTCRKSNIAVLYKAATPAPTIPHSYASSSAVAQIMKEKFVNHVPLYRQENEWKRLGLELSRATMANWIIIASKEYLIPLKNRMHEILVQESHLHSDETPIQVLNEPGKANTSKSYMWVYASIKESKHPIKIFEYKPDRSSSNPQSFLEGFKGTIITDGYQGYNHIEGVTHAYCWAHVRRKFRDSLPDDLENIQDALAKTAMDKIAKLFSIEKEIENKTPDEKVKIRQEKSKPLLDDFFSWCAHNQDKVLVRSKIGKAIQYALNYESGLREYTNDGLIPMTNSLDERTIRPFAVGRRNWLFCGSTDGAEASAAAFTIIETAKANHLDPFDYLEHLFDMMPNEDFVNHPERLDDYLPWSDTINELFISK